MGLFLLMVFMGWFAIAGGLAWVVHGAGTTSRLSPSPVVRLSEA